MIRVQEKSHFFILPQLETVFSTFYSLVLLIKTINMYVICIWAYISLIMHTLYKKNNWLRLRWLWLRLAEVETVIPHGNLWWLETMPFSYYSGGKRAEAEINITDDPQPHKSCRMSPWHHLSSISAARSKNSITMGDSVNGISKLL